MLKLIKNTFKKLKKRNWKETVIWLLIAFVFLANSSHEKYPDEFDNICGGWLIRNGKVLYRDFFTHHNPLAYYLSAIITFFSGQSFVKFRIILALFWFSFSLLFFNYFKKRFGKKISQYYLIFTAVFSVAATFNWLHMMLADSLATFLFIPVFLMMITFLLEKEKVKDQDLILINLMNFFVFLSTQSYSYLVAFLNLFLGYLYLKDNYKKLKLKRIFKVGVLIILPYLIFGSYLLLTKSYTDYYHQAVEFNLKYYIYNYPKPTGSMLINPIRYSLLTFDRILEQFWILIQLTKDFSIFNNIQLAAVLSIVSFIIWAINKKNWQAIIFILALVVFSNFRNSPLYSEETDYQIGLYLFSIVMLTIVFFPKLKIAIDKSQDLVKKITFVFFFFILSYYWTGAGITWAGKWEEKMFDKYMGTMPLIYDRPEIASIVNQLLTPDDYVWIGPFHFEEMFFVKAKAASKYTIILPEFRLSEDIKSQLMSDIKTNKPKIIFLDQRYFVRGSSPEQMADYFISYLREEYVNLDEALAVSVFKLMPGEDYAYNMDMHWWFRKNVADEMIEKIQPFSYIVESY